MKKILSLFLTLTLCITALAGMKVDAKTPVFTLCKVDAETKAPLPGATFTLYSHKGVVLGQYTTGERGCFAIDELENGWYKIAETMPPEGYVIDDTPHDFQIVDGKPVKVTFENRKQAGLRIKILDCETKTPLPGASVYLESTDGSVISAHTTNLNGDIFVTGIETGDYYVRQTKAVQGYIINKDKHLVKVNANKYNEITICNKQAKGVVVYTIDKETKQPVEGVTVIISDKNHRPITEQTSDRNGMVVYKETDVRNKVFYVRETNAPTGYHKDMREYRVETSGNGELSILTIQKEAIYGTIAVLKRSGSDHLRTGVPAGSTLGGAEFGLFRLTDGSLIKTFVSQANGWAIARMPLGEYFIKEIKAPAGYRKASAEQKVVLTKADETKSFEIINHPANTAVQVRKYGPQTAVAGTVFDYTINEIRNNSSVPLHSFYMRDVFPKKTVQPTKITTGLYNIRKRYNLVVTTDQRSFVARTDLMTTNQYQIDLSPAALNLLPNEYITEIKFDFGYVPTGFTQIGDITVSAYLAPETKNGLYFVNKVDVGGNYQGEWVISNETAGTTVINPNVPPREVPKYFPKTGY